MESALINKVIFFFTNIYSALIIKLVVAIIILLIGLIIGKIAGKLLFKLLSEININNFFQKAAGLNFKADVFISNAVTYLIDFFVIIIAFDAIAFTPTLLYIFAGALIVIIVFSIIIGIKDLIPNLIAGMMIYQKKLLVPNEQIRIDGHNGKVKEINLFETTMIKKNGDMLYIPNSAVLKHIIVKKNINRKD